MKLPQPVQNKVPRLVVANPNEVQNTLMVNDARNRLMDSAKNAADIYSAARDQTKLASSMGQSLGQYSDMLAHLENKEAFDLANDEYVPKELRDEILSTLNVDLKTLQDEQGRAEVPGFAVRGAIHDYHAKKIQQAGREFIGNDKKLLARFDSAFANKSMVGSAAIVEKDLKQEVAQMSATGDELYTQSIQAGDALQASETIDSMENGGLWSPAKVAEHRGRVVGDVQYADAVQILVGGDASQVTEVLNSLGGDEIAMTNQQKADVYAKGNAVLDEKESERKKVVKFESANTLNDWLLKLGQRGVLPWGEIERQKGTMEPNDYRALVNANRAAMNQGSASADNPLLAARLATRISRLSYPEPGVPFATRKLGVINEIHQAMGLNPETGEYFGDPQLKSQTFFTLQDQVNKVEERILNDPRLEARIDQAYRILTGAGRDVVDMALGATKHKIAAAEYEAQINQAALEFGPGFDSQKWHDENWVRFKLSAVSEAYEEYEAAQLEPFIVERKITVNNRSKRVVDKDQTLKAIKEALANNEISEEYAIDITNRITLLLNSQEAKYGADYE